MVRDALHLLPWQPKEHRDELIICSLFPMMHITVICKKYMTYLDLREYSATSPMDLLYSQKLYAPFNRKRPKGRDFFHILGLCSIILLKLTPHPTIAPKKFPTVSIRYHRLIF